MPVQCGNRHDLGEGFNPPTGARRPCPQMRLDRPRPPRRRHRPGSVLSLGPREANPARRRPLRRAGDQQPQRWRARRSVTTSRADLGRL